MIGAVDIGGTKTLMAVFNNAGKVVEQFKIPTNQDYEEFKKEMAVNVANLSTKEFSSAGVVMPGVVDRKNGRGLKFGNLPWSNIPLQSDFERLLGCPVVVDNDAKAAGLSEAININNEFKNVLYLTIGTGIGIAYIVDGVINPIFGDRGGNAIELEHHGKIVGWETFASGKAIVKRFGKRASDINDKKTWRIISHDWATGLWNLIALVGPDVVVIGGGVGTNFSKFKDFLKQDLEAFETPILKAPPLRKAKRPEEAVIYGCYELAKAKYGRSAK